METNNIISIRDGLCKTWLPLVEAKIQDLHVCFIIDTGSTHSMLDKSLESIFKDNINYVGENSMHGIEGNKVSTKQGILNIIINDKEYELDFCFMQLGEAFASIKSSSGIEIHGILGNNFLIANEWVIDYGKFEIRENVSILSS